MPLLPLKIGAGVFKNGTQYQARNRWFEANLVRFSEGRLRPIGGWARISDTQLEYPVRGMHSWRTQTGAKYLAIGTTTGLYLWDGNSLQDITPTSVDFSNLPDTDIPGLGYGILDYGGDAGVDAGEYYGVERELPALRIVGGASVGIERVRAATWHLDNLGDTLLATLDTEGSLWRWDDTLYSGATAGAAVAVTDATPGYVGTNNPADVLGVIVAPERHTILLAPGGDRREIGFSSQGTYTDWTAIATNTAGSIKLQTRGEIVTARKTRYGVLVFTNSDVHKLNYLGPPVVYATERIADATGPVGANAIAGSADILAWMSDSRFWYYDGYVRPLPCDVADYVFGDINLDLYGLVSAGHNPEYSEIWWYYPRAGEEAPSRYVGWNYRENTWITGDLPREHWHDSAALGYPVASSPYGGDRLREVEFDNATNTITVGAQADLSVYDVGQALKVRSKNTLPTGLSAGTTYYMTAINTDSGTLQLAASAADAESETVVAFTSDGDGPHTLDVLNGAGGYLWRHELEADGTRPARDASATVPANAAELANEARLLSFGADAFDAYLPVFAETGAIDVGNGTSLLAIRQLLTDTDAGTNGLRMVVKTRQTPDGVETTHGPYDLQSDGYTDVRLSAREMVLRIESGFDQEWRFGELRADATQHGKR